MNEQPQKVVFPPQSRGESLEVPKRDPADIAERERILGQIFSHLKKQRQLLQREQDHIKYLEALRTLRESSSDDSRTFKHRVDKTVKELESLATYGTAVSRRLTIKEELNEIIQTGQYDDACSLLQLQIETTHQQYEVFTQEIGEWEGLYREDVQRLRTLMDMQQKTAPKLTDKAILSSVAAMQSMPPISNDKN